MKKTILSFIVLVTLAFVQLNAQTITSEGLSFELKKGRIVGKHSILGINQVRIKSDKITRVKVKVKIKAYKNNKTKLSALSLVDLSKKIRYRLSDFIGYACPVGCSAYSPARLKKQILDKRGKPLYGAPLYDPSEKDYFKDFNLAGFTNMEVPVNFGKGENKKLSIVYFAEAETKKLIAELYFAIFSSNITSDYALYYKDEKVCDVKL